jgi:hypothetical protein
MLTLWKCIVLGAAFLAEGAIAAHADRASANAAGTVTNGESGSQSQGRELAALPLSTAVKRARGRLDVETDDGAQMAVRAGLNASDQLILNLPIGLVDGIRVATASEARLPGGGRADRGLVE